MFETKSSTTGITQVGHFCYQITYVDTENCKTLPCVYLVSKKAISYCIRFPDRLHHIAHTVTSHFLGKSRKKLNCTKKCIFSRRSHFFNCHRTSETKKWNKSTKEKKDIIGDLYQEERCFFPVSHIIWSF